MVARTVLGLALLGCQPGPAGRDTAATRSPTGRPTASGTPAGTPAGTTSTCLPPGPNRRILGTIDLGTGAYEGRVTALRAQDAFGQALGSPGDVNGDGLADLVAFAAGEANGEDVGIAYLILGPVSGELDARSAGVRIEDPDPGTGGGIWGTGDDPTARVGDLDGDGVADLALAVLDGTHQGVYLLTGLGGARPGDVMDLGGAYAVLTGQGEDFGSALAVGDLTGDGAPDLVIGHRGRDAVSYREGTVYVLPGPIGPGTQEVVEWDPVMLVGAVRNAELGAGVQVAPDLDGDGLADLVVYAQTPLEGILETSGVVYVFFGPVTGGDPNEVADRIYWGENAGDYLGRDMVALGDADGDGRSDLALGGENYRPGSGDGAVYLVRSPIFPGPAERITGLAHGTYHGAKPGDGARRPWAVGDLDLDGMDDLAVGADGVGDLSDSALLLLYGPLPSGVHPIDQVADATVYLDGGDDEIRRATGPGDMDGDCGPDLAVSVRGAGPNGGGAVYLLLGGSW